MTLPTGKPGQMLALGITLLALAALWLVVAAPLVGWYGDRAAGLAQQRLVAGHMAALAASLPALRREAAAVAPAAMTGAALLEDDSDALAGARLQERVQTLTAALGVTPASIEVLPVSAVGAYRRIGLRIAVTADWPVLIRLLQSIEQAAPRMLIDDLQLRPGAVAATAHERPIAAQLSVLAFRAGGGKAP